MTSLRRLSESQKLRRLVSADWHRTPQTDPAMRGGEVR